MSFKCQLLWWSMDDNNLHNSLWWIMKCHKPLLTNIHFKTLKQKLLHYYCCNPTFGRVWGWRSHSQNGDLGVLWDSQNFRVSIVRVKTPRLKTFFISLESYWSVNVENGLTWAIWTYAAQIMAKRGAGSQTGNLTPDHYKSGIDPTPACADGMRHTIGNFSMRATSLLHTSSQSEVRTKSYELTKAQESKPGQF
jgi:hypothetical protein